MIRQVQCVLFAAAVFTWAYANAATCAGGNETDVICGKVCEATCAYPDGGHLICPPVICIRGLTSGCRCNLGYARNAAGNCILLGDCP